ncbi:MAG: hypothetical protein EBW68_01265 [Actinobacteria bacterium]|nr:hypothetical protein [Actinomycetota bacterium]
MSHRQPSLARRIFPAFALTTVGVGMVHSLDRPAVVGARGILAPMVDPSATTVVPPVTNAPGATATPVTAAPVTAAPAVTNAPAAGSGQTTPATNAPVATAAPVTAAPAAPAANDCGALNGTGSPVTITWRRDYGVVQVTAKFMSDGTLCKATAQYQTYDSRSERYESYAIPILNKQASNAGNANIQGVSGATAISDAYIKSLQSAIDHRA